jgi:PAS domain-containing protein
MQSLHARRRCLARSLLDRSGTSTVGTTRTASRLEAGTGTGSVKQQRLGLAEAARSEAITFDLGRSHRHHGRCRREKYNWAIALNADQIAEELKGAGIGLMHYTGMAALHMPAYVYYDLWFFALSIAVAILLSTAALFALTARPRLQGTRLTAVRITGAAVMGFAIVLMHYTGMYATYFYPEQRRPETGVRFDPPVMAAATAIVSLMIVCLAMAAAWFDRRIERAETLLRDAIESFSEGFVVYDQEDRLVMCNQAYRWTYAESADLLTPGTPFEEIAWRGLRQGKYPDARAREGIVTVTGSGRSFGDQRDWRHEAPA